jgi:EpsD family peptidyl-prolyl cis-trans isomerase
VLAAANTRRVFVTFVSLALVAACGKDERAKSTQVAARVNSDEITVHQINSVLVRVPSVSPEQAERAKREVLERLIDQQLAVQQAMDRKLDRTPAVQVALEAARSEILARAYFEQVAAAQPKPTTEEAKQYYAEHPNLFAERRLYRLEEITLGANAELAAALRARAAKARSMKEIADWLQSQQVKFAANRSVRAAEQIALDLLSKLHRANAGEIIVAEAGPNLQVIRVLETKTEPVDAATAAPRIQQFLSNRRASEAVANELKHLRAAATIKYAGEFADHPAAHRKDKAEPGTQTESAANANPALGTAQPMPQEAIKKGIEGIR